MYMWEPLRTTVQLFFNYQNYKSYVWNSYSTYYGGYFLENSKTRWCYKSKETTVSLISAKMLKGVTYQQQVTVYNGPTPKYLTIPTEYCWVQTYLTYSYYEDKKYLLYKNMGMLLSRLLEWNGKPNPLKYYNKVKVFRYVNQVS